ncbi:MAG: hypothetical protein AABY15_05065 [Nanoarchaeota archaeon]
MVNKRKLDEKAICPNCGKKIGFFTISQSYKAGKRFCSFKCAKEYQLKQNNKISEIKCKCKECGHVWHYLSSEEQRAKSGAFWGACGMTSCCFPIQLYSKQETLKWQDKLDKFKRCPKCGSVNITKKEIEHDIR